MSSPPAFRTWKLDPFWDLCADDLKWTWVGDMMPEKISQTTSRQQARDIMAGAPPMTGNAELSIDRLLADGNTVVCGGVMRATGQDGKPFGCYTEDFYTFKDDKIVEIYSHITMMPA